MKEKERIFDEKSKNLKLKKMTKKKSLQEKGITLIALVVTIIILLILAGVTLNIALSDNGLFSKTQEAADKYKKAQEDEEELINNISGVREIGTAEELKKLAEEVNAGGNYMGYTVTITKDINLSEEEEWTPIGTEEHPFEGIFEGNYHKINGIKINTENDCQRTNWSK